MRGNFGVVEQFDAADERGIQNLLTKFLHHFDSRVAHAVGVDVAALAITHQLHQRRQTDQGFLT